MGLNESARTALQYHNIGHTHFSFNKIAPQFDLKIYSRPYCNFDSVSINFAALVVNQFFGPNAPNRVGELDLNWFHVEGKGEMLSLWQSTCFNQRSASVSYWKIILQEVTCYGATCHPLHMNVDFQSVFDLRLQTKTHSAITPTCKMY